MNDQGIEQLVLCGQSVIGNHHHVRVEHWGHTDPYIPINQANTGSVTNAQDTVRVAIGVSLRVKNKRDQNRWNIYELHRRYVNYR